MVCTEALPAQAALARARKVLLTNTPRRQHTVVGGSKHSVAAALCAGLPTGDAVPAVSGGKCWRLHAQFSICCMRLLSSC